MICKQNLLTDIMYSTAQITLIIQPDFYNCLMMCFPCLTSNVLITVQINGHIIQTTWTVRLIIILLVRVVRLVTPPSLR